MVHTKLSSVSIEIIPHKEQRYDTAGDWQIVGNSLQITVSETGNWVYDMAIALHELVEALICIQRGIEEEEVSKFDIKFEERRKRGNEEEPGDDPKAPYHLEHGFASACERLFIAACGENWKKYDRAVGKL